jgi:predicted nucleotidyltransferase
MKTIEAIRLPLEYIEVIKKTIKSFDEKSNIFIFGSRTDPLKKGGDIDILVISDIITWKERRKIKVELIKKFGERRIDLIIASREKAKKDPFISKIEKEGIKL